MSATKLNVSRRIRATPYKSCVESLGVSGYSVVNHTVLPKGFRKTVEEDYWHLKTYVQIAVDGYYHKTIIPFIIYDKVKEKYAGSTRFRLINWKNKVLHIGWTWIGNEFQGT